MVILRYLSSPPERENFLIFYPHQFQFYLLPINQIFVVIFILHCMINNLNMLVTGWLSGCCIAACFILVIYFTKIILDYLDSKPSGRRTLMDELNKVSLYSFLLIILSNYPFTIVLIFGPDLSHCKYIAEFLSIVR